MTVVYVVSALRFGKADCTPNMNPCVSAAGVVAFMCLFAASRRMSCGGSQWSSFVSTRNQRPAAASIIHVSAVLSRSRAPGGGAGSTGVMDSKHANPRALVSRFAKQDVLVLRNLLSPWEMQTVRAHYKEVMHMIPPGGDRFVTSCTSDRLGYWLNMRLKPVIETIAGQRMHPSYSYLVKYYGFEGNPGLKPHTDQVDNEYTVTIAVDWEPSEFGPVPIYFGHNRLKQREQGAWQSEPKPHERTKVDLHYGDAMLFRGRRHAHFRNAYPLGKNSTNLLIHFVKDSYPVHQNRWLHNQAHKNE